MYHSITIGYKNTWDDWHLIPTVRPTFSMPKFNEKFIEIPGRSGSIDLSEYLIGGPTFSTRSGSLEFLVMNGYGEWQDRYSAIANYLHGRSYKVILEDDPLYYYHGRFSINSWTPAKDWSKLQLNYVLDPFKKLIVSDDDWLWDPLDFGDSTNILDYGSVIPDLSNIQINSSEFNSIPVLGSEVFSKLIIVCSGTTYMKVNGGEQIELSEGTNYPSITLNTGINSLSFKSEALTGTVMVNYQGGSL